VAPEPDSKPEAIVPVVEETVRIGKRPVTTDRVVVRKTVHQHDETIQHLLRAEELSIERVRIGLVVDDVPAVREEGDTLIVPVLEEQLVVTTRLVLTEEVRIRRAATTKPVRQTVRLRRERVSAEHLPPTKLQQEQAQDVDDE
jgi:stress response protein YsnF